MKLVDFCGGFFEGFFAGGGDFVDAAAMAGDSIEARFEQA